MEFTPLSTQNWNRAFSVWIDDIQVQFKPVVRLTLTGGFLRKVRGVTRFSASLVAVFFLLHCSKPRDLVKTRKGLESAQPKPSGEATLETGGASWYGGKADRLAGETTASGEPLDPSALTCAHRTLPLGSYVEVENLDNGRKLVVRVNDRGPFIRGRILDLTRQGAVELGFLGKGLARVQLRPVQAAGTQAVSSPVEDKENPLTIQVAALADPVNIDRLTRELRASYGDVVLQNALDREGRPIKRVQVGSFSSMEEAEKASSDISKRFGDRGVEPFITRRR